MEVEMEVEIEMEVLVKGGPILHEAPSSRILVSVKKI
jgi:hypothetical protein